MSSKTDAGDAHGETRKAGAFDIRTFIAMLIGVYGVVLVVTGLVGTSQQELDRAGGINVNLWAGLAMVVVAALFQLWAKRRPVIVPEDEAAGSQQRGEDADQVRQGSPTGH